jgi:hypothetical protein
MQPFRLRFRRFSLQIPGEVILFLLTKIAVALYLLQRL